MVRALMAACCLSLVLAGPAAAASFDPSSPEFATALQVGQQQWGGMPCGGKVAFAWRDEDPSVNATSYWSPGFTNCEVVFNRSAGMDAVKFCTIMVHELGHLHGREHASDPDDVMAAYYSAPLPACSNGGGGAAPAVPVEEFEEAETSTATQSSTRVTKRRLARAARLCNRKQTRRAIRRCKRTLARRATRRKHVARSVTAISATTLLAAPMASHH